MLHFETEYGIGQRARFNRTYRGFPAFVAIAVMTGLSLAFGIMALVIGLVAFILRAVWLILIAVLTMVVAVLSAPFRAARMVSRRIAHRRPPMKPTWVAIDDIA